MLKKGNGLDCLKVQILNGKLQVESNIEFSFNRNIHRLSAFKLTIWNDTSFPLLCKIHMRLKTRPFASSLLYPATGFICACLFSHVAGHPQEKTKMLFSLHTQIFMWESSQSTIFYFTVTCGTQDLNGNGYCDFTGAISEMPQTLYHQQLC